MACNPFSFHSNVTRCIFHNAEPSPASRSLLTYTTLCMLCCIQLQHIVSQRQSLLVWIYKCMHLHRSSQVGRTKKYSEHCYVGVNYPIRILTSRLYSIAVNYIRFNDCWPYILYVTIKSFVSACQALTNTEATL